MSSLLKFTSFIVFLAFFFFLSTDQVLATHICTEVGYSLASQSEKNSVDIDLGGCFSDNGCGGRGTNVGRTITFIHKNNPGVKCGETAWYGVYSATGPAAQRDRIYNNCEQNRNRTSFQCLQGCYGDQMNNCAGGGGILCCNQQDLRCAPGNLSAGTLCDGNWQPDYPGGCVQITCGWECKSGASQCTVKYPSKNQPYTAYLGGGGQSQCDANCGQCKTSNNVQCTGSCDRQRCCASGLSCIGGECLLASNTSSRTCQPACGGPQRGCGDSCSETCQCTGGGDPNRSCSGGICTGGSCGSPTPPPPGCGANGQNCCSGSSCDSGLICSSGTCTSPPSCGGSGQNCCSGNSCNSGLICQGGACVPDSCGEQGERCCGGSGGSCNSGLTCQGNSCLPRPAECTVSASPNPLVIVGEGVQQTVTANVSVTYGTLRYVEFATTNGNVISVNPGTDNSSPYQTTATAEGEGNANINVSVWMDAAGVSGSRVACQTVVSSQVVAIPGWWQAKDADLFAVGDLRSSIPQSCAGQNCTPRLILPGSGGYTGVPAYSGSANYGSGSVSSSGWSANTSYTGRRYDYDWYRSLAPSDTEVVQCGGGCNLNASDIIAKAAEDKVAMVIYEGNVTITSLENLNNKKIAMFVNGDLNINGRMLLTDGSGFFATFVKGNINVSPSIGTPSPTLEGLFVTDGRFSTGNGNNQFYLRGSVVAWGGVSLQRDLGGQNNQNPAEVFEYAPDLILSFPPQLFRDGVVWREVAP